MPRRTSHDVDFVWDPRFDYNLLHWKGTLNPVSLAFRLAADKYAQRLRSLVSREIAVYSALAYLGADEDDWTSGRRQEYLLQKAMLYSLRKYRDLVYATLERGAATNTATVASGHAAADRIEYGGTDSVINVDGEYLQYPAYHFLSQVIAT